MPCSSSIEEAVEMALQRWPNLTLTIKNSEEACGPCPICGAAQEDGFLVFASGYFWDRKGGCSGWLDDDHPCILTPEQIAIRKHEAELKQLQRQYKEHERRLNALERLNQSTDHILYHQSLDESDRQWWHENGIGDAAIDEYLLGVCYRCPMDYPDHRPSYTIPIRATTGELLNIQHRLIGQVDGDRYRPHLPGLPGKALFNARHAINGKSEAILCEGAKKSIVLCQYDIPAMAVLNKHGFDLKWLPRFTVKIVTLCPDPDAVDAWAELGKEIAKAGLAVNLVRLPMKPDDLLIAGSLADFEHYLSLSRRIH